jgi:hypothetical protein
LAPQRSSKRRDGALSGSVSISMRCKLEHLEGVAQHRAHRFQRIAVPCCVGDSA